MAWQAEHKVKTRQSILNSAAKLFALEGYDQVGINQVMADANLTRGAFYNHFNSKSELYAEAIISSAQAISTNFSGMSVENLIPIYLSQKHLNGASLRCPLAFLTTDITQRDEQVRSAYTRIFKGFVNRLNENSEVEPTTQALQKSVMLIGGMAIARAINDDILSQQLLEACKAALLE